MNGRDAERSGNGVPGTFTLDEAITLCHDAGVPAMIAHHYGLFEFNTVVLGNDRRAVGDRGVRRSGALSCAPGNGVQDRHDARRPLVTLEPLRWHTSASLALSGRSRRIFRQSSSARARDVFITRAGTHFQRCGIILHPISFRYRLRIAHERDRPSYSMVSVMTDFNILELIVRHLQPTLKRGSLKMAQAVLADPTFFAHASLASVSARVEVSDLTVLRLRDAGLQRIPRVQGSNGPKPGTRFHVHPFRTG